MVSPEPVSQKSGGSAKGPLILRQRLMTRLTHWVWVICLFFLLLSGLQIFNARPDLYIGSESGFEYDNSVLSIGSRTQDGERIGVTRILDFEFETTGVLGVSGSEARPEYTAFPGWATIPSARDLATGRVVHFFFAWLLVGTLLVWLVASVFNRHLQRDLVPRGSDARGFWADVIAHVRFRFRHKRTYSPLQKLSYAVVLFILFPMIILTGLTMSPGMNAVAPFLLDIFGGRQTARTLHFVTMVLLVGFFVVHILMVLAAGPINEMRSMITGRYRLSPNEKETDE